MSSPESPHSSKKRKSPFFSDSQSTSGLTNKRRRGSMMSLSRDYSESNESFSRVDDEDTRSLTSVSVASMPSEKVSTNYSDRDYASVASRFGINLTAAKKFYRFLINQPKVAIVKYIKRELTSPSRFEEVSQQLSPEFSVKRRVKKKLKVGGQDGTSSTTKYNSICGESVNSNSTLNETLANAEPLQTKKLTKRAKLNVENYLETLRSPSKVEKDICPASSAKKELHVPRPSENLACDSEDEFQNSNCPFSKKTEKQTNKIVVNPFSINEQAQTNSEISKKKESFWMNKFGSIKDLKAKKQTFLDNFKKEDENDNDTQADNVNESLNGKVSENAQVESKNGNITNEKGARKKVKRRRTRIYIPGDEDETDSDVDIQTYDSLSVNCQQVNVNSEDHVKHDDDPMSSPIISFGEGHGHDEHEDEDEEKEVDVEQDVSFEDDIIDICADVPLVIDEETTSTNNNLANGVDENFSDHHSDDLFNSPTKLDSPPGRLVIDLTPTSSTELSPSEDVSTRPKGRPKIKSDTKLATPIYNIPMRRKHKKSSPETSPSSSVAESNESQSPSKKDTNQPHLSSVSQQMNGSSATPTTRGLKASLQQVKCNLNNEESLKEYQNAKTKITFGNNVDESFDEICQDVTNLTNTESITLYKGCEDTESSANDVVVLNTSLNKNTQKKEDVSSLSVFNNNVSEAHAVPETRSSGSSDTLNQQKTPTRTTRSSVNSSSSLGFLPKIPRKDKQLNKSADPVTSSESRDPRLNRTPSPNKPLGVLVTDVRVTRSSSQKSPSISSADPRLTRGQSRPRTSDPTTPPTNISPRIVTQQAENGEEVKIVDPRIRKRKEREEAERAAKLAQELEQSNSDVLILGQSPQLSQFGQSSPVSERKQRNVFQRLGCKEPSPVRSASDQNEFIHIIKSKLPASPTKSYKGYETDDDRISLHPGVSDFYDSSDEDDNNSSPRHRKFESERNRKLNNVTAPTSSVLSTMQHAPQQQRLSAKQRLGMVGDTFSLGNRRTPITAPGVPSTLAPPIRTTTTPVAATAAANPLANRLGTRPVPEATGPLSTQTTRASFANVPPPNVHVPPSSTGVPNSQFVNNPFNIDYFYQMNTKQMAQDEDNMMMDTDDQTNVYFDATDNKPSEFDHRSILDNGPDTSTVIGLSHPKFTFFNRQCFRMLREGKCRNELTNCKFQHQIVMLFRKIKTNEAPFVKAIIQTSIDENFDYYLDNVWKDVLPIIKDDAFTIFEKLYQAGKRNQHFVIELIRWSLSTDTYTVDIFLRKMASIIEENDCETVQAICTAIKTKLEDGFCWETIRCICTKAAPPRDIVELIMLQCLKRKKNRNHILEVHNLIKTKMLAFERNKISLSLMKQFNDLVARQNPTAKDTETLSTMPLANVTNSLTNGQSFQRQSVSNVPKAVVQPSTKTIKSKVNKPVNHTPRSPDDTSDTSPNGKPEENPVKGESRNSADYKLKTVAASEPKSAYRDRFWKLYASVDNVLRGLTHKDYDYVLEQLNKFCQEPIPQELLKRGCYQVLCRDVRASEERLSQVLQRAAKKSSEKTTRVLFEVAMHALVDLGDNGLWVMAAELLENMTVFKPEVPHVIFVLISAEIHLANSEPIEALYLLQKTKLIRTNRDEWLVTDSKKADEKHRNKVVFILLQALAYKEPEKAVFLYQELMADQYIYYYPIDLSRYVDKLTLLLFVHKRLDLAVEIARVVMANDMTFQKPTYQEVLSRLLPVDEVLVNQILDYAVHLGYYPDINIREGFTTLIVDTNYNDEEIYLMLKRLIRQLTVNLGPTIARLKSSHLKVTLVFEDIPSGKRLSRDETATSINLNKNRQMRSRIADILSNRFEPQIKLSQGKADRFCKIMSRTLVNYLKHWH